MDALMQAFLQETRGWLVATIVALLPMFWALTMMLNVGRPYFLRELRKCNVRFGADVWWLSSVLLRDAVTVLTLAASFLVVMPRPALVAEGNPLSLPLFAPLATELLFLALAVKLTRDCDDDPAAYRTMVWLLSFGALLYFVPTVFGIEAGSQAWMAPVVKFLGSRTNPGLFTWVSGVSVVAWLATAGYLIRFVLGGASSRTPGADRPRGASSPAAGR